jgi:hypothetical protein
MTVVRRGNTKKKRMTAAEFDIVLPHLNMTEDRINAARAALVENQTLESIAQPYGWNKQAVGTAVNTVWTIFQRVQESLRIAEAAKIQPTGKVPDLPDGWSRVVLDAPDYLIERFKAEIEEAKREGDAKS